MSKKITTEDFIKRAKDVHGNKYDYSKSEYKRNDIKIIIICKKHGEFNQIPNSHLIGYGCQKCGFEMGASKKRTSNEEFIKKSRLVHGDKYDYSLVEYKNATTKVKIICQKHGVFEQLPYIHFYNKSDCLKCSIEKQHNLLKLNTEDFVEKARKIHGEKYDYSMSDCDGEYKKIKIICKKHGVFEQAPNGHLSGKGCLKCRETHGENKIRMWLEKNNIRYETQKTFHKCRDKGLLKFDFYVPSKNFLIEFDGEQHYNFRTGNRGWNNRTTFKILKRRDEIKNNFSKNNGINLLRIPYFEMNNIENILYKNLVVE